MCPAVVQECFLIQVRSETYHHIFDDYKAFANWYLRSVALQTEQSSTSDVLHLALLANGGCGPYYLAQKTISTLVSVVRSGHFQVVEMR